MERLFVRSPSVYKYIALFAAIATILILGATALDTWYEKEKINYSIHTTMYFLSGTLLFLFINHYILSHIYTRFKIKEEYVFGDLSDEKKKDIQVIHEKYSKPKEILFTRFEELKKKKELVYGYVIYKPFFWKSDHFIHKGIGCELYNAIFSVIGVKLNPYNYPSRQKGSNWNDIFVDLCEKKFDIIMTPLFETRSRLYSYNILYCLPIFYSNIGIYIRRNSFGKKNKLSFYKAIDYLRSKINSGWKAEYIPGELSETLLYKYSLISTSNPDNIDSIYPAEDEDFAKILENVNEDGGNKGDFVFMEVFKANMIMNMHPNKLDLVNILQENQLLYPVSFVVRKEETVLKNFINLRLMELRKSGMLENIIKDEALKVDINEDEFKEIFIQKYDFKNLEENVL